MEILYSSLHNLDMEQENPIRKAIPADFNEYMEAYIEFAIKGNKSFRAYEPIDKNRTVLRCIADIFTKKAYQGDETELGELDSLSDSIAHKLLSVEKDVQEHIGQMTDVQKGSIVQALLNDNDSYKYVIAKVEHSEWYDGDTLRKNFGFPGENKRVWKSAVIGLDIIDDSVSFTFIKAYVNHPAKYWSADFLEIKEEKTDTFNTKAVFRAVERSLRSVKKVSPRDYYNLRNTILHELQSGQTINYPDMVGSLLDAYEPASTEVNVADLKTRLLEAQERDGFDTQFNTDPDVVKRPGKITIDVSPSVHVVVKEGIPNWRDEFLIHHKSDGRTYLMIRCDDQDTLKSFPLDEECNTLIGG